MDGDNGFQQAPPLQAQMLVPKVQGMKRIQAKDIPDSEVIASISVRRMNLDWGWERAPRWVFLSELEEDLEQFPPKVVLAKLKGMIRRGIITGCACGCRGDFEIVDDKDAYGETMKARGR